MIAVLTDLMAAAPRFARRRRVPPENSRRLRAVRGAYDR
jgi:hypothetical protein